MTYPVPRLFWFWKRAITIWWPWRREPRVYVPRGRSAAAIAVTEAHEAVHVRQWRKLGRIGFLRLYLTKRGRIELEAEAFAESVRCRCTTGGIQSYWIDHYAGAMARGYGGLSEPASRDAIVRHLA